MRALKFLGVVLMGIVIAFGLSLPWSKSYAAGVACVAIGAFAAGALHAKGGVWVGLGIGLVDGIFSYAILHAIGASAGLTMPSMAIGGEFVQRMGLEIVMAMAAGELGSRSRVLWARRRLRFQ
jgi:hypothetical protein